MIIIVKMALYLIGLGLGDEKDVTVRGQEVIRSADVIFLEAYTSILCISKDRLVCRSMRPTYDNVYSY